MEKLTIGQMAKLNQISERALRIYHDLELLVPQYVDESTSYRYYSSSQSKRLNMILQMKSVGLSLKQIKIIMDNKDLPMFEAVLLEQIEAIKDVYKRQRSCWAASLSPTGGAGARTLTCPPPKKSKNSAAGRSAERSLCTAAGR